MKWRRRLLRRQRRALLERVARSMVRALKPVQAFASWRGDLDVARNEVQRLAAANMRSLGGRRR
jgi:hypothetical protein